MLSGILTGGDAAMDDEIQNHLAAMEARITARIDAFQEAIVERVQGLETSLAALLEISRATNSTAAIIAMMKD
jgi:CHASE3 domain sensor protein